MTLEKLNGLSDQFDPYLPDDFARVEVQLIRELITAALGHQWQPIETAPKDGTPILLWAPEWKYVSRCGWWQSSINGSDDAGWTDGTVISWNYQEVSILLPTRWMPLPDPPTPDPDKRAEKDNLG